MLADRAATNSYFDHQLMCRSFSRLGNHLVRETLENTEKSCFVKPIVQNPQIFNEHQEKQQIILRALWTKEPVSSPCFQSLC